jgi:HK97 family phage prohead protease
MDRHNCGFEYKFVADGPEGTFEGYGSTFGMLDDGGDMMMPGCFDKTLAQCKAAGAMPKMLLNHGGMAWGSPTPEDMLPIGKWSTLSPDSKGLQAKGRLINLDTESGKRIHGAMKEGELSGLSIGYKVTDFTRGTKAGDPRRTIKAVDLHEISPVTFPMDPRAQIGAVKAAGQRMTIREFEIALRDTFGFSHAKARAIAERGFRPEAEEEDPSKLAASLRKLAETMRR